MTNPTPTPDTHAWVHEHLAAALLAGLSPAEQTAFDNHVNACPECFDAFTEARAADRALQRSLSPLQPSADFEKHLLETLSEKTMHKRYRPALKKTAMALAASVALAATGLFAQYVVQHDTVTKPLSDQQFADAREKGITLPYLLNHERSEPAVWVDNSKSMPRLPRVIHSERGGIIQREAHFDPTTAPADSSHKMSNWRGERDEGFAQEGDAKVVVDKEGRFVVGSGVSSSSGMIDQIALNGGTATPTDGKRSYSTYSYSRDGQNVGFGDAHAEFFRDPDSGKTTWKSTTDKSLPAMNELAQGGQAPPSQPENVRLAAQNAELLRKINEDETALRFAEQSIRKMQEHVNSISEMSGGTVTTGGTLGGSGTLTVNGVITDHEKNVDTNGRAIVLTGVDTYYSGGTTVTAGSHMMQNQLKPKFVDRSALAPYNDNADAAAKIYNVTDMVVVNDPRVTPPSFNLSDINKSSSTTGGSGGGGSDGGSSGLFTDRSPPFDIAKVPVANGSTGERDDASIASKTVERAEAMHRGGLGTERAKRISQLMESAKNFDEKQDYRAAADSLRQALVINPDNDFAKLTLKLIDDKIQGRAYRSITGTRSGESQRLTVDNKEHLIPYTDLLVYPESWVPLTRSTIGDQANQDTPANLATRSRLEENMKEISSDKQPLEKVVAFLHENTGTNITVDWAALEKAGIDRNTPVSINLKEIPFRKALSTILSDVGGGAADLGYKVDGGVIKISTRDAMVSEGPATTAPASGQPGVEVAQRKIIRNGEVEFEVVSFDEASTRIAAIVTEEGGFVSSTSSDKLANGKIKGQVVVRVPPERLDRLLLKIHALGDLKTQQIAANDVTKQYTDIDSELRALRTMETRLIDLIKNGKGEVKDLVVAEKQLGEYRVRIEKLEGEIRYYNNLVGMATLTITAYEKDIQKPTAASEMENVALALETEDVEAKYKDARKILDDAKGRIVESELKKYDADQYSAHIVVDVPPDKTDFVTQQLKQIGRVGNYTRDRKQTTTGGSGVPTVQVEQKDTRFVITLYNLALIPPRETAVIIVAVRDVDASYHKILETIRKQTVDKADENTSLGRLPTKPVGRVLSSSMNGQQTQQMSAEIRADVRADQAQAVLQAIMDTGEVITSTTAENADSANTTSAKRGIQLRLVNVAAVEAREKQNLRAVAANVPDAYKKLLAALQSPAVAPNIRIITSQLSETDPRTVSARLSFEARREVLPAVDKAFADAGIDFLTRNITRANDASNTLDSKVYFQIDELIAAEALAPRRTTVLGVEVDSVEKALDALRASLPPNSVKELEYSLNKDPHGHVTGHLVLETPVANAMSVLMHIKDIGGTEKVNQVMKNNLVPDAPFARERIDLTLASREALVESGKGVGATIRAALGSAATALLLSLYYVLTGILFLGPFLLILWLPYRLLRRRPVPT